MLIISIDAALAVSGLAALQGSDVVAWTVIKTEGGQKPREIRERVLAMRALTRRTLRSWRRKYGRSGEPVHVAVEVTDWAPGARDDRSRCVREAKARWGLGMAVAAVLLAADDLKFESSLVGVTEWMAELGSNRRELGPDRAAWCV